ncbi:olfactory receptor 510-like [Hyla sarda]|uniref:olfactory receptor 510-like n=1 Tax=Hyla sarda TaxID=327740 RepID=UPI0024C3740A|nr:olfactory receptor 510-like [Hyla sarda]
MCEENRTKVTEFHLLGFRNLYNFRTFFFIVLLVIYIAMVVGNLLIILLVSFIDHLQIPMFYFLKHLAVADLLLTTIVVPVMLDIILKHGGGVISFNECLIQLCVYGIFTSVQCFLLAVMSYDRYLAICHPLHYVYLMSPKRCVQLMIVSWSMVVALILSEIVSISQFEFCGPNTIDHFVCDFRPVIKLITSNSSIIIILDFAISGFMFLCPFVFIIITYICIFITILKGNTGRKKVFSTCSSHLTTVCTYYGALITVYMSPSDKNHSDVNMYLSLLYIVVIPLINPIIYSLRNHEIERAIKKVLKITRTVMTGQ